MLRKRRSTVNLVMYAMVQVTTQAKDFLRILQESSPAHAAALADDVLVFLYRLRDNYRIIQSKNRRFSAKTFSPLFDVIYNLEAKPDETMENEEWRKIIVEFLTDLATGRILVGKK